MSDRSPPKRRVGWILIDAPFAHSRLVKQNSSVRPFDEHASSAERPRSLTESRPKPLSSLPSRDRRSVLELPEPDRRGARAPRQAELPRQSADTKSVGSSPRPTSPHGPMFRDPNPHPSRLPEESRRRAFTRSPPLRLVLDPRHSDRHRPSRSRVAPSTSGRCSACGFGTIPRRCRLAIALSFHGFLVPLRGTPSPSLRARRGRRAPQGGGVVIRRCRHLRLTVMDSTAGGPTSRHPSRLGLAVPPPCPGKRHRRAPPPKRKPT